MPEIHREMPERAERDASAGVSGGEAKAVGAGCGGGGGGRGGGGGTGVAARAEAARGGPPPADEKENMNPVCLLLPSYSPHFSVLCSACLAPPKCPRELEV